MKTKIKLKAIKGKIFKEIDNIIRIKDTIYKIILAREIISNEIGTIIEIIKDLMKNNKLMEIIVIEERTTIII
jgi:hypothetical protein